MNQETAQGEQASVLEDTTAGQETPVAKKGPGRPKKQAGSVKKASKKTAANGNPSAARSAGRPKKSAQENTENPTRAKGRGRPAGSTKAANAENKARRDGTSHDDAGQYSDGRTRRPGGSTNHAGDNNNGFQEFGAGFMAFAQSHMEKSVLAAQRLLNCRSLEDMAQVQSQYLQESFDNIVKETSKMTQNAANFAKKTAEPLNAQMEAMMQKFQGRS